MGSEIRLNCLATDEAMQSEQIPEREGGSENDLPSFLLTSILFSIII